jgi:hypothetical protein
VEAECLNQARSVLCGGRPAIGVPTAIRPAATPYQYYRQYAAGKFEKLDAIFINGFHESHLSTFNDTGWRSHLVGVSDGGDHYWCAIYVKGLKGHFVIYKERRHGDGDTHVSFHGVA